MEQKDDVIARLDAGLAALCTAIDGCSRAAAAVRPAPDRWSVLECVEHLAIAEEYLSAQLRTSLAGEPSVNLAREERIIAAGTNRSRRVPAPELSHPAGRYATLDDALNAFLGARAGTRAFVDTFEGDLRAWHTTHPIIGPVNAREMLLMIAIHPMRHAQQIDEIRAALTP